MPTFTRIGCAILALTLGAATALPAQEQTVIGSIKRKNGAPVAGYPVVITGNNTQFVAITDAKGAFTVDGITPGTYAAIPSGNPQDVIPFTIGPGQEGSGNGPVQWLFRSKPSPSSPEPMKIGTIILSK
jgi:hypothetical protein